MSAGWEEEFQLISLCVVVIVVVQSISRVLLSYPWTVAHQAPLSMEFSRQEYWSGLPLPSRPPLKGDLLDPGIQLGSPTLQEDSLSSESSGKASVCCSLLKFIPLSQWFHLTLSSSATLFSFGLQSFPASGSFPMSQLFLSGGQSIGASASATILLMNIQGWFPLEWTGLISLQSKGLSWVFSSTTNWKRWFLGAQLSLWSKTHICTRWLEKPWLWPYKATSTLLNTLSRFVIPFLLRSKHLFISWLQSFGSPRKENLLLLPLFLLLSAMRLRAWMPLS